MSRVAGASTGARTTAADVKALADPLSVEAENLQGEVRRFQADVQAASYARESGLAPSVSIQRCGHPPFLGRVEATTRLKIEYGPAKNEQV